MSARVERWGTQRVRAEIAKVEAAHPGLSDVSKRPDGCSCPGCAETAVAEEYGWTMARAWSERQGLLWLIGED